MTEPPDTLFYGDQRRRANRAHPDAPSEPEPYVASADLVRAVNLAIYLNRPLLLEGEAGCGKTRLARAVAYELGLPFYPWYVRSNSKAQDGLYSYDAILRLHDVHTRPAGPTDRAPGRRDPDNPVDYRRLGALGRAFSLAEGPAVVLIDEIDKADVDFPNDLLTVLDDPWAFEIPETGERIAARFKPIVIITSNKEKGNLPAPFLRRCVYFFIEFPDSEAQLNAIVDSHYQRRSGAPPEAELTATAIRRFLALRKEGALYKRPGTSEFLDWLEALRSFSHPTIGREPLTADGPLPYRELLFKLRADWQRYPPGS
jgi:MoxR-like ATPase